MKVKIITWNIQGINSTGKNKIKALIRKWQADAYCFQEMKMEGNMEITVNQPGWLIWHVKRLVKSR